MTLNWEGDMRDLCLCFINNTWRDFKHNLKRSFHACLKSERTGDKRLSKDEWDVLVDYWLLTRQIYLILLYVCSFRSIVILCCRHILMDLV